MTARVGMVEGPRRDMEPNTLPCCTAVGLRQGSLCRPYPNVAENHAPWQFDHVKSTGHHGHMAKRKQLQGTNSCERPSYGGVLSGDAWGGFVQTLGIVGGVGLGYLGASQASNTTDKTVWLVGGGVAGLVLSMYPSLLAQRSATRSANCEDPGLGRLFGYNVAKYAGVALARSTMQAAIPNNKVAPALVSTVAFFLAPLAGQAIIKTS